VPTPHRWTRVVNASDPKAAGKNGSQPARRVYRHLGLQVHLPSGVATPRLSAHEAIAAFGRSWGRLWDSAEPPQVELMYGNSGEFDFDPGPGLAFAATFNDRLVWVLSWRQVASFASGADRRRSTTYGHTEPGLVDGTAIVDANTGELLAVLENGREVPPSLSGHP